jgi:hypothetical protein
MHSAQPALCASDDVVTTGRLKLPAYAVAKCREPIRTCALQDIGRSTSRFPWCESDISPPAVSCGGDVGNHPAESKAARAISGHRLHALLHGQAKSGAAPLSAQDIHSIAVLAAQEHHRAVHGATNEMQGSSEYARHHITLEAPVLLRIGIDPQR